MSPRQRPVVARSISQLGQSEVSNLYSAFCVEHDVLWLDVTMHNAFLMSILQGIADLLNNPKSQLRRDLSGLHQLPQVRTVDVFHDEVEQRASNRFVEVG